MNPLQVDQATIQTKRISDDIKNGLKGKWNHRRHQGALQE